MEVIVALLTVATLKWLNMNIRLAQKNCPWNSTSSPNCSLQIQHLHSCVTLWLLYDLGDAAKFVLSDAQQVIWYSTI